jgi:ATP-dependent Clp protease ATP-binding subunit ClpC
MSRLCAIRRWLVETFSTLGATTLDEYRTYIEQDPALQRHFQEVIVHEVATTEETVLNQSGDNDSTQEHG